MDMEEVMAVVALAMPDASSLFGVQGARKSGNHHRNHAILATWPATRPHTLPHV